MKFLTNILFSLLVMASTAIYADEGEPLLFLSAGVGINDSADSVMFHLASPRYDPVRLFVMTWTDNNDEKEVSTGVIKDGDFFIENTVIRNGDTGNLCGGAAYTKGDRVSVGVGLAYCFDDNTQNIDDHVNLYFEGLVKTPGWPDRCGAWLISDDEAFLGCQVGW